MPAQQCVGCGISRRRTGPGTIVARELDAGHTSYGGDRELGLVCTHELEDPFRGADALWPSTPRGLGRCLCKDIAPLAQTVVLTPEPREFLVLHTAHATAPCGRCNRALPVAPSSRSTMPLAQTRGRTPRAFAPIGSIP